MTCGSDGFIRIWSAQELLNAQYVERDGMFCDEVKPVFEIDVGRKVSIRHAQVRGDRAQMILQDINGIIKLDLLTFEFEYIKVGLGGAVRSISMANQATDMQ